MDPYTRLTREWNINVWVREDARLQEVSFHETLCLMSSFQASQLVKLTRPECVAHIHTKVYIIIYTYIYTYMHEHITHIHTHIYTHCHALRSSQLDRLRLGSYSRGGRVSRKLTPGV